MDPRRLAAVLQTTRIIHFAMMVSVVVYGVVLWQLGKEGHSTHAVIPPLTLQYGVLGATIAVGGVLMAMGTMGMTRARRGDPHRLAARVQTPMILRLAGAEAVALGGFVGTQMSLTTNFVPYIIGAVIALGAMASFFPRASMFQSGDG